MHLRFGRILILAVAAEALAILSLVALVATLGPTDPEAAQQYAARLGRWVGPIAGFVFCVLGGWLAARGAAARLVLHGLTLGAMVAAIDVLLLLASGSAFEWLFVASNAGRLVAGSIGGFLAGRGRSAGGTAGEAA